jgi:hypothetical protein
VQIGVGGGAGEFGGGSEVPPFTGVVGTGWIGSIRGPQGVTKCGGHILWWPIVV